MNSKMPNFLVVGSTKAGTTSVYNYLLQHPNIFLNKGVKESNFFVQPKAVLGNGPRHFAEDSYGKLLEDYEKLFESVDKNIHSAVGEVCTTYLHFSDNVIPNVKHHLGDPKIIIFLRNPVDRAFSYYMHNVRDGEEKYSFEKALEMEDARKDKNLWLSYRLKELGNYCYDVENYLKNFSDVKVFLFEDMQKDLDRVLSDIFDFLGVKYLEVNTNRKYNISGIPKIRSLNNFVHGNNLVGRIFMKVCEKVFGIRYINNVTSLIDSVNLKKIEMNNDSRNYLEEYYSDDISKLSEVLNIDLNKKWSIGGVGCEIKSVSNE